MIWWGERFLVLQRASTTRYMPGKWDIPGGTIEFGESPEAALMREIDEETKITADIGNILFVYNNVVQLPDRQTFQMVYEARYVKGDVQLRAAEHQAFKWVTKDEVISMELINFLDELMRR